MGAFHDSEFQERILQGLCGDRNFLKRTAGLISADDFKPRHGEGTWEAYYIAEQAFHFWNEYREPIGGMLRHQMLDYMEENKKKLGRKSRDNILDLVNKIRNAEKLVAVDSIERKIKEYKQRQAMSSAIKEFIKLKETGELTPKKFYMLCKEAVEDKDQSISISHYEKEIEKRIHRREHQKNIRYPYLFIEQLDRVVRTFPKKNIGIALARYKTGKSTFAVHLDQSYALQNLNVLHITTEDPKEDVEDKLDASFAGIKLKYLADKPKRLRRKLNKALERLRARIKIVDATEGGVTVNRIEEIWETQRNQGFDAHVIIIDADEGIEPATHYKQDNGEIRQSKEMYSSLKRLAARIDGWVWVMAQTQRGKKGKRQMIVTGDDAATDISKVRRCAMAIGIGDGPEEFGEDGRYIYIAAHRYDRQKIGWPIMGNFKYGIFYDKERTARYLSRLKKENGDE